MRILVVGNGSIGRRHAANLAELGVDVLHLPFRDLGAAALAGFDREGGIDGLVIATATQVREELFLLAAERGWPVYAEKPLSHDPAALARIAELAAPQAERSVLGYMMRYHPILRRLAALDLGPVHAGRFEIGHDVRQWRQNWRFSDSYAARPAGGGVLLDLCHEIDMADVLVPGLALGSVACLGHPAFPGVDFATEVRLEGRASVSVAMDYLNPVSTRRVSLRSARLSVEADFIAGRIAVGDGARTETLEIPHARNEMFLALMRDWLRLVAGEGVEDPLLPRLDRAMASARRVAEAHAARRFTGEIAGEFQ